MSRALYESLDCHRVSPGEWTGLMSGYWLIGKVVSGGYATTVALNCAIGELRAASHEAPLKGAKFPPTAHPDVLSANTHFMSSVFPGSFTATVDILKSGKTTTSISMSLLQDSKECLRLLVTLGNIAAAMIKGPNFSRLSKGKLPPLRPLTSQPLSIFTRNPHPITPHGHSHFNAP